MSFDPNAAAASDSGIYGLPHGAAEAKVHVLPVPFDATTSYRDGTRHGPQAVLEASRQVDLFDLRNGKFYERGIFMLPIPQQILTLSDETRAFAEPVLDAGGVDANEPDLVAAAKAVNDRCANLNDIVYNQAKTILAQDKLLVTLGGDHATPFGSIRAVAERFPGVGILHLDAHADLRHQYEGFVWSHASIMDNVILRLPNVAKLVQVGIRDFCEQEYEAIRGSKNRIVTHFDQDVQDKLARGVTFESIVDSIVAELPTHVYLSWDIDGLDPALCPTTGTPVPGGLSFHQAICLLEGLIRARKRIVGLDLCEVAPGANSEWDANVAARLLYKMIGYSLRTQG